ncbi:MAG: histidine phosphatase family protein [Ruminococcaceae bacterium]|nr:histidine phosphatase family protein [Oscillospiraceae bacterium]
MGLLVRDRNGRIPLKTESGFFNWDRIGGHFLTPGLLRAIMDPRKDGGGGEDIMRIYIVRHGETDGNTEGYFQGWTDDPLNEKGRELAAVTGRALSGIRFDRCISSPLSRARETAEILLRESGNGGVPIELDDRAKEAHLGDWEHKKFRAGACELDSGKVALFFENPFLLGGFPGGETVRDVCRRTQSLLTELLRDPENDGATVLVTTHGFATRAMLNALYDDPDDFWHGHVPYNCAVNVVEGKDGIGRLVEDDRIFYAYPKAFSGD